MKQISSVDLFYLVIEFKQLENQRIDSFFYTDDVFYIQFYIKRKGKVFLINKVGKYVYMGKNKQESAHPSSFVQHLRKYLKNSYLISINQVEGERILLLDIEKKNGESGEIIKYKLVLELFSNGNVILCDEDYNIKNSLIKKRMRDRKILVREKYCFPPKGDFNVFNLDKKLFELKLKEENDFKISAFLATKFGIGGKFAKEVCAIAKVDSVKFSFDLNDDEISRVVKSLKDIFEKDVKAYGLLDKEGNVKDFIPFDFLSVKDEKKEMNSFNDVVCGHFSSLIVEEDKTEKMFLSELKKLERRVKTQEKQKESVIEKSEKNNAIGNKIYENYVIVEELLESINKAAKEKGWGYVMDIIKSNDKLNKIVKKLDYKNNEIVLEL